MVAICYSWQMSKKTYFKKLSTPDRETLAGKAGTSVAYLSQIAYGVRNPSATLAKKIDEVTEGDWPKHILRPDIYDKPNVQPQ